MTTVHAFSMRDGKVSAEDRARLEASIGKEAAAAAIAEAEAPFNPPKKTKE